MFNHILLEVYYINLFVNKVTVVYLTLSFIAIAKMPPFTFKNKFERILTNYNSGLLDSRIVGGVEAKVETKSFNIFFYKLLQLLYF